MAFRFFHCLTQRWATRVFSLLAFSTAWHGAGLRAFSHFLLFPLPGMGPDYARFLTSCFFHCLAWGRTTRVFSLLAFSTARYGAGLRAFSHFLRFPLPGTALGYARFLTSRFFHCPTRGRTTRVFSLLAFSTARLTRFSNRYIPLCISFNHLKCLFPQFALFCVFRAIWCQFDRSCIVIYQIYHVF